MEFTLLLSAATGFFGVWVTNRVRRDRYPAWLTRPTDLLIGVAAVGMLTGRLTAMVATGVNPITHPFDILLVRGGVNTAMAAVGACLALAWTMRDHLAEVFDLLVPASLAGLAGWHGGCVWRGTCLGAVTDLPWGMAVEGSTVTRHPVELYTAAGLALAAFIVGRLPDRPMLATGAGVAAVAGIRLATEPLRLSVVGGQGAVYSVGLALGSALILASAFRPRPEG